MNMTFQTLADEAVFVRRILGSGITKIGKANYADKGNYFLAFTGLSVGLERLGKLCLLLDFYIHNEQKFPPHNYFKKHIGHDLISINDLLNQIIKRNNISFNYLNKIEDPIHLSIINILSSFGKGDRYSNFDYLSKGKIQSDPVGRWSYEVDQPIYNLRVTNNKKLRIEYNAYVANELLGDISSVYHIAEDRSLIRDMHTASRLTGITQSIYKYRILYCSQIIRFWLEILKHLQYEAMAFKRDEIPFLLETFSIFLNDDKYILTRKNFENIN